MTTTLDTSGIVTHVTLPQGGKAGYITWGHLNEFTRGYVEAALSGPIEYPDPAEGWGPSCSPKFDWLSPDTLAAMMADCEAISRGRWEMYRDAEPGGACFWEDRQKGIFSDLQPLTLYLSEDGLIHHREASK